MSDAVDYGECPELQTQDSNSEETKDSWGSQKMWVHGRLQTRTRLVAYKI